MSPADKLITSPTTTSSVGNSTFLPSRRILVVTETISSIFSVTLAILIFCAKLTPTEMINIMTITKIVSISLLPCGTKI